MVEQDTIKLLRECDAGVKMGISSIDEVLDNAEMSTIKLIQNCKSYLINIRTREKNLQPLQRVCHG